MSCCNNCGNNSCDGNCKKACIKVYKPTRWIGGQTGIQGDPGADAPTITNIVDNGDGTFTIFLSDGSDYTINIPNWTEHPNDPWFTVDTNDLTGKNFVPGPGIVLNGVINDIVTVTRYDIISPNTISIQTFATIPVTVDTLNPSFNGQFNFEYDFPVITSVVGGWFNGTNKVMSNANAICPVTVGYDPASGTQHYTGACDVEMGNSFGLNKLEFNGKVFPGEMVDGDADIILFHNATAELVAV